MANLATINNNLLADSGIDPLSVVLGSGTANQIAYWIDADNIGALTTATYPSLTELSYVKGVTSSIQTQLNAKQATLTLTTTGTSGAATLVGATLNIPQYQSVLTNPVTGTGTANYHAKWISGSAIGNSLIFDDGTNVGIDTNNFGAYGLSLTNGANLSFSEGAGTSYANIFRQRNSAATVIAHSLKRSATSGFASSIGVSVAKAAISVGNNNGSIAFFSDPASAVANGTDFTASERVTIVNDGSVGIGNPLPSAQLHIRSGGSYINTDANNRIIVERDAHTYLMFVSPNEFDQGIHFAKTTGIVGRIAYHQRAAGDFLSFTVASVIRMTLFNTGNLYLGSSTAVDSGYRLDVEGAGRFTSTLRTNGVLEWNGGVGALSYNTGVVTMETNSATRIELKTNGTTALTLSTTQIATFTGQTVAANGSVNIDSADPAIRFRYSGGTADKRIYEWRAVAGGGVNDRMELRLWNDAQTSVTVLFTVSPTGAGTFTSSATSTGLTVNGAEIYMAPANYASGGFTRLLGRNATTGRIEGMSAADVQAFIGLSSYISGSGTANYVSKFTSASVVGDSALQEVSGNLGLNVAPPAWTLFKAINIGGSSVATNGASSIILSRNWYYAGGEKYFENGTAQRFEMVGNGFFFQTAADNTSGAGAALTWVSRMTLNSSGNLLLNESADNGARLQVGGTITSKDITITESGSGQLTIQRQTNGYGSVINFNTTTSNKWFMGLRGLSNDNFYIYNQIAGVNNLILDASTGAATITAKAPDADRTIPINVLTLVAEQGNAPYGPFGGAILFRNRSYVSGLVDSSRIRSVIYDDGAPNNFGGGIWFETTQTPGGTLTPSVVINYQGRVGISNTSPFSLLHVGTRPGAGTTNPSLGSIATVSNDGLTGIDLGANVNANNVVGHINWVNYLGVGNYNTARIDVYAEGGSNSGALRFWTASASSSPTVRLTIASNGPATFSSSVTAGASLGAQTAGIGNPSFYGYQQFGDAGGGGDYQGGAIALGIDNGSATWYGGAIAAALGTPGDTGGYPGGLAFWVKSNNGATGNSGLIQAMRIKYNGFIGVNTVSPNALLHVYTATSADTTGHIQYENANTGTGSAANAQLIGKSKYGTAQLMVWENYGIRFGMRSTANGGDGSIYFTTGTDSVKMLLSSGGHLLIGTTSNNGYTLQNAGNTTFAGQFIQGGGSGRSTYGTTVAFTSNTTFVSNTDIGDGARFLSIVNESATTSTFSVLSFRNSPSSSTTMLDIKFVNNGSQNSTLYWTFNSGGGWNDRMSLTNAGALTATSFFESSDVRLKSNIIDLDVDVANIIAKHYIKEGVEEIGYLAQDVEAILPSAISKRKDGYLDLSYRQVHTAKIAYLEKRITELEQQLKNNKYENN